MCAWCWPWLAHMVAQRRGASRGRERGGSYGALPDLYLRLLTRLYFAGHQAYAAYITSMHFFKHGVWQGVLLTMLASGELQS